MLSDLVHQKTIKLTTLALNHCGQDNVSCSMKKIMTNDDDDKNMWRILKLESLAQTPVRM